MIPDKVKKIVGFLKLKGMVIEVDELSRRINITADEDEWFNKMVPDLIQDFKYLISVMARSEDSEPFIIDINNYRKERERLILELAKAAAQKAVTTKQEVKLPSMNAYERRLIHVELAIRPDVKTESIGEGRERGVVIKPI